jgi:ribose-phosphate pyrophosphokinase
MRIDSILINLNPSDSLHNKVLERLGFMRHAVQIGKANIQVFSDGETCVDFKSTLRGKRVYLLSSPSTPLMREQLLFAIDAARRASAMEIIPIMPYCPYARQDKRDQKRGPIGARVWADNLQEAGATSIITFDLHSDQIEGFFKIPVIHLRGKYMFSDVIIEKGDTHTVLCSPDAGGLKRVKKVRDKIYDLHDIKLPFISLDKTRKEANKTSSIEVLGDVKDKNVIIIDDMCDTGGTLIKGTDALLEAGANEVRVLVTHAVLSGEARINLAASNIKEFICSDGWKTNNCFYST